MSQSGTTPALKRVQAQATAALCAVRSGTAAVRDALASVMGRSTVTLTLGPVSVNVAPKAAEVASGEPCELVRVATRTKETR